MIFWRKVALFLLLVLPAHTFAFSVSKIEDREVYNDVVLSPSSVEFALSPGESTTRKVYITNRLGSKANFSIDVEDFTSGKKSDEALQFLGDNYGPYSLKDYVSSDRDSFSLEHGEMAEILVSVDLPENVLPGGRYAGVFFSFSKEEGLGEPSSRSRVGSLFFVRINGPTNERGEVVDFGVGGEKIFIGKRPSFLISYKNDGNVYLNPYGGIEVYSFGRKISEEAIEPYFVLPSATRIYEKDYSGLMLPGKTTAVLRLNRGYQDIIETKEIEFWHISYIHLGVIIVFAIIILFVLKLLMRKR